MNTAAATKTTTRFVPTCSCGCDHAHRVMERRTADGVFVYLYSDATITGVMGGKLPGVPLTRPQSREAFEVTMAHAERFMAWVNCYGTNELGDLWQQSKIERTGRTAPKAPRAKSARQIPFPISWKTTQTDRDGRPTEWLGEIPRLTGLRLCVIRTRREYVVCDVTRRSAPGCRSGDVAIPNGVRFTSRHDLDAYLRECQALNCP